MFVRGCCSKPSAAIVNSLSFPFECEAYSGLTQSLERIRLPSNLNSLILHRFDQNLVHVQWPNLHQLVLGVDFSQSSQHITLSGTLQNLTFGQNFNQSLEGMPWPRGLQHLTLGKSFNQILALNIVNLLNLRSLTLGNSFNKPLEGLCLPSSLERLEFGNAFNQPLDMIEWPKLQSLIFGVSFNQSLRQVTLPSTLKELTFGTEFNQSLAPPVNLPHALQSLVLGRMFDHPMDEVELPDGLQNLTFGSNFNQTLANLKWPSNLQSLVVHEVSCQQLDVSLPSSLQSLDCMGLRVSFT